MTKKNEKRDKEILDVIKFTYVGILLLRNPTLIHEVAHTFADSLKAATDA